ncbi:uncharacterized protein LOC141908432 [Tubulanus polymorphus]|uniref:uncharacterized protein LOC141908432 n=1 Tax=Tubulanus polymorphus TaxID=672921 RepID=UPI003DA20A41
MEHEIIQNVREYKKRRIFLLSKFERIGFKRISTGTGLKSMDGHEIDWSWASIPKTIRQTSCVFTVRLEGTSSVTWKADDCFKLSRFTCKIPDLSCTHPIGLEDGSFSDFQIGASSTPSWSHLPSSARLHNQNSAWCAGTGSYIQFTFLHPLHFFGIQTQGWQSSFVTSYNVSVLQNNAWSSVFNQNGGKVFPGNEDGEGVLTNFIHEPIEVEALRLHITGGNGAGDSTEGCLRVEILGCTDDGSWSDWSSWSTCSASCGSGITKRTRFCNKPRPRLGGKDCAGDDTQTDTCIIHDCPVDGGWSCWGGWSPCIVRDDTVLLSKSRYRVCDNPAVANGGRECSGEPNEFAPCRQTVKASDAKKVFQTEISDCDFASSGYRLDNAAFLRVVNMSNCGLTNLPSDLLHRANNLEVLKHDRLCTQVERKPTIKFTISTQCSHGPISNKKKTNYKPLYQNVSLFYRDLRQNNLNDFQIHQHKSSAIHLRHLLLDRNVEVDYVIVADHPQLRTDSDFRGVQINLGGSDVNDGQTENIPCNEPTDLTIVRDADDVITIRCFNFDLSHLNDYFWDTNPKKIRIHAISVTMTRDVSVHYNLEIVTSSFTMAENVGFLLDYEPTRSRMSGCTVQFMRARNCKRPTPQLLLLHYQTSESSIDILTRFIRSPFKCSVPNEPLKVPEFDDFQLKMSIFCARELHERANSSALTTTVLEHVISLSTRNIGPDFSALKIESEKFRIDWKPARGVTEHEIPTLSSNAQAQQMLRIAAILNEFDREISELENRNENEEIRLESARNMMRNQRNRIDLARANLGKKTQALRNSLLTLDKISSEFNRAILATEAPRANCEIHLKTSVTVNILKSIGTLFSGKVVTSVQEISAQIGLLDLLDAIEFILDSVRKIVAAGNEALDAKTKYGVDFEDVEKGSELNVKMVVWDALSSTVDTHFDKEKVMALPGCAAFRKLLKDVTLWGKSMTQETITLAAVTNDFFLAEENADAEIRNYERFEIEFEAAFTQGSVTSELVVNARMQAYYYKEIAYDALHKFCRSFFYHYFIDCPRRVRPSIGDSLKTMSIKMNSAISLDFSRLYFDCFTKPVKFEIQLKDDERMNYSSVCASNECPIKHLRENGEVYFELNPDDVTFIGYERIRVTEMRVFLTGIRPVKDDTVIRVSLSTASVFKDRYRYHDYQFRTTARKINFAYVVKTGVIKEHACMSGTYANLFTELPPFTRWKLEISERLNPSLDIRQLKSVSLFLLTHATNTAECDFNNNLSGYSSTRFDIGDKGNAPLSLECT